MRKKSKEKRNKINKFKRGKSIIVFIFIFIIIFIKKYFMNSHIKPIIFSNTTKIAVIFGTRPEAIKLIPLIKELKSNKNFSCITINTGQHKEMIHQILKSFNMDTSIDYNLELMEKNQSLPKLTSKLMLELDKIYTLINPDVIIVQGDTTTSFISSLCAFYHKIPVFHVEAGLRTHNLLSPFPEEYNRKSIDLLANLYFASTDWAASNLLRENINESRIFVTGNTVVDSLYLALNNTSPSQYLENLIAKSKNLCSIHSKCKIILLTCHRRENYNSVSGILDAIFRILKENKDIVIIFPYHLNPNIKQSIKNKIPLNFYDCLIKGKIITNNKFLYLNRFILIPPLDYIDLIHLQSKTYFIMTDSGGIQEEGVSMGKPILILRNTTERPEAIQSGCAILVGTSSNNIYKFATKLIFDNELYRKMAQSHNVYGNGNSSKIIYEIINNYFNNNNGLNLLNKINYTNIFINYDKLISLDMNSNHVCLYDLIVVLTVWKRNNLENQLIQVKRQSIIKNMKVNLIVFQNSNHVDIRGIIDKWKKNKMMPENIIITHIQSPIETGYYGRFLIPLTSQITNNASFIICDDDVVWGDRYFENMLRVVGEGYLATRNGRIIDPISYESVSKAYDAIKKYQICFDEDIEHDFGGHLWAGKIDWLRKAWTHIPISLENCEDFWISAVLKSFYNISTKTPRCPCPKNNNLIIPDLCAASGSSCTHHVNAIIGNHTSLPKERSKIRRNIANKYNYTCLVNIKPEYVSNISKKYIYGIKRNLFNLTDDLWKHALFWQ